MDEAEQVEDGGMIALGMLAKNAQPDAEQIGLCREVIGTFCSDYALSQLSKRREDV
jgi:hypothetical protein